MSNQADLKRRFEQYKLNYRDQDRDQFCIDLNYALERINELERLLLNQLTQEAQDLGLYDLEFE